MKKRLTKKEIGAKKTQEKDINKAKKYWIDYQGK